MKGNNRNKVENKLNKKILIYSIFGSDSAD